MTGFDRRSLICLNIASFFGAFNDNALKVVTCLLAVQWAQNAAASARWVAVAGASFVLPYLFFSMLAGSLADRMSKSRLFVCMQWVEVLLMGLSTWGLACGSLGGLVSVLFLTGAQSALFSPAKYAMLPELFPQERLAWVNGIMESTVFAGILVGTLAGSFCVDIFRNHLLAIGFFLVSSALIGALVSHGVRKTPPVDPYKKLRMNPVVDVWEEWKILRKNKLLSLCTWAIGYFWFLGALVQMNALVYARHMVGAGPTGTGILLGALAIGVGAGSFFGGKIAGPAIRLFPVRAGLFGVASFLILLAFSFQSFGVTLCSFFLLGLSGGCYIVPLNTVIQARSPAGDKGRVIATTNFFSFCGILLASGVLWLFASILDLAASGIFFIASLTTLAMLVPIWLFLPVSGISAPLDKS